MSIPTPIRADARRNEARILRAAARLLADDPETSLQRIAEQAGVSRRTVYRRYRDREALRQAIAETALGEAKAALDTALARGGGPVDALRALIVEMAVITHRYPVLLLNLDDPPRSTLPAAVALRREVRALIDQGRQEGALRAEITPELIPRAITGTLFMARRVPWGQDEDPSALGAQVADLLLGGITSGGER